MYVDAYQPSPRLEIFTTSPVCGAWMNSSAADVDAHVAEAVEEDEVAGLQVGADDGHAHPVLRARVCGSDTPSCA